MSLPQAKRHGEIALGRLCGRPIAGFERILHDGAAALPMKGSAFLDLGYGPSKFLEVGRHVGLLRAQGSEVRLACEDLGGLGEGTLSRSAASRHLQFRADVQGHFGDIKQHKVTDLVVGNPPQLRP